MSKTEVELANMGLSEVNGEASHERLGDDLRVLEGNSAEMREIHETNGGDGSGDGKLYISTFPRDFRISYHPRLLKL